MGRSATSLIAQALHKFGVHMGEHFLSPNRSNPEGYYEDKDFYNMNTKILATAGGSAFRLPTKEKIKEASVDVSPLLQRKNTRPLWGWKDPRTVITIEKYYDKLEDPILVVPFRRPEMVAKSVARQLHISYESALHITEEYQQRCLDFLNENFGKNRNETSDNYNNV